MTPITERLAEALRGLWNCADKRSMDHQPELEAARAALAEYDRLRTHPAEGGDGRVTDEHWIAAADEVIQCFIEQRTVKSSKPFNTYGDAVKTRAYELAAAPPPQPVTPEACGYCGRNPREPTHDLNCPVAPERGEAKAVVYRADINELLEAEHRILNLIPMVAVDGSASGAARHEVRETFASLRNIIESARTPQPPPAPRFRDPTIEDGTKLYEFYCECDGPGTNADDMLDALNAIGAKVGEKT